MGRTHARLLTAIWTDDDFRALDAATQRTYLLLMSQPDLSICGVLDYNPKRLARLAADTTPTKIAKAVRTLEAQRYIVVDADTDELVLRTFLRHDGVLDMPNPLKAAARAWSTIHSPTIRKVITDALPTRVQALWPEPLTKMRPEDIKQLFTPTLAGTLPLNPSPEPLPEGLGEPPGTKSLAVPRSRSSSSSPPPDHAGTNGSPTATTDLDEDLTAVCRLIAERKLEARTDSGEPPPANPAAWTAAVIVNDTRRLAPRHRLVTSQHPDWTIEQLADELDPDTADRIGNYMNADETDAWLAEQEARAADAVPMPDHVRQALRS